MIRIFFFLVLASLLLAPVAGAQDWINVKLNEDTTQQLQNEQQVVVNPTDPLNLVSVWRDFRLGYRQVGYAYTFDGGATWTNPGLFVDVHYPRDSDPALTVNSDGDFFAMLLAYTGNTNQPNGMLMYRSTDGGMTWEDRGFAINQVPGVFEDKEFIACDRSGSAYDGRIYMVWDRFYETNIYCVSTGDEGDNWTSERRVSDQSSNQFPTPAVGHDGTIYVAWTYFGGYIRFDKSTDGGLTFGSDRNVTSVYNPHPTLNGGIESPAHPAMDVDISDGPYDGRIYIAYLNRSGSSDYDIYVRFSDDQGSSWSNAIRINDDAFNNGRDQFHPWLTVDNSGVVTAVWLDRRHDPSNLEWHCYISQSTDGGLNWSPNQQVSTMPSHPYDTAQGEGIEVDYAADRIEKMERGPKLPGPIRRAMEREKQVANADLTEEGWEPRPDQETGRAGTIGEYIGIASYDGFATAVWTDTRHGHQDTYAGVEEALNAVEEPLPASVQMRIGPNPADGPVGIRYQVPADGRVTMELFDVEGRRVRTLVDRKLRAGDHAFVWDGTDQLGRPVASGTYWVRYAAEGAEESASIRVRR
ncbi:MAG: hypothetical protein GF346_11860 [Candidatus Eisenbacteria bacterium]|nr:hypothetical protein [Candidatus Latescibacterota bacterium]MBD3303132.1 hypothetical protein [Candidatus Eisenbacteria bacterium]